MKPYKTLGLFLFILISINIVHAETYSSFIKIVGVDNEGRGIVGNVTVEIQPGKGRVLVDTTPLQGIYTQDSERIAVKVAGEVTGFDFSNYDVIYSIMTPNAHVVEGPSAGGVMTVATIAAVEEKKISSAFTMTGTIQEDGSIGFVGEVLAKAKAAADADVTLFLIPKGQAIQNQYVKKIQTPAPGWYIETVEPVPVNVIEYAKENWGLTVYEVSDINEAVSYAFGKIPSSEKPVIQPVENISLPKFISPVKSYNEFSKLIEDEIAKAKYSYENAYNKLSQSSLPQDEKSTLDSLLEKGKAYLDRAEELKEMGYLYAAGNEAFKSTIDLDIVNDMIEYYSLSGDSQSLYLENRLNQVKARLSSAKEDVVSRSVCDPENFEWGIAARQRIAYAENKINSIELSVLNTVEILYAINTADEWIDISKNFLSMSSFGNSTCLPKFEEDAKNILLEAENEVNLAKSLGIETATDAEWYLNIAKKEFEDGWYLTAIYDATSAKVRAEIGSKYEGKTIDEIYDVFNKTSFTTQDLLDTIYLEYSHFLMYEAIKDDSDTDAALGIEILMLSKEFKNNNIMIKKKLGVIPFYYDIRIPTDIATMVLILIIFVGGFYMFRLRSRVKKLEEKHRLRKKDKLKKVQKEVDNLVERNLRKRLEKKEITREEYIRLKRKLLKY